MRFNVSISEIVVYEDYFYPSCMSGKAGDQKLAADRIRRLAIKAGTLLGARGIQAEALSVDRSSDVTGALHGTVDIIADFIHADDEKNMLRTLSDRGYAVGVAIDVYEDAVVCDRISTREEEISVVCKKHGLALVFVGIAVYKIVIAFLELSGKADGVNAHGAAH